MYLYGKLSHYISLKNFDSNVFKASFEGRISIRSLFLSLACKEKFYKIFQLIKKSVN